MRPAPGAQATGSPSSGQGAARPQPSASCRPASSRYAARCSIPVNDANTDGPAARSPSATARVAASTNSRYRPRRLRLASLAPGVDRGFADTAAAAAAAVQVAPSRSAAQIAAARSRGQLRCSGHADRIPPRVIDGTAGVARGGEIAATHVTGRDILSPPFPSNRRGKASEARGISLETAALVLCNHRL